MMMAVVRLNMIIINSAFPPSPVYSLALIDSLTFFLHSMILLGDSFLILISSQYQP